MEDKLDKLIVAIGQLAGTVSQLAESQAQVLVRLDNLEGQLNENTQIVKAIRHNTETTNAEINGLKLTTLSKDAVSNLSTKEDINKLHAKFEALNSRLFHQETELCELKAVK